MAGSRLELHDLDLSPERLFMKEDTLHHTRDRYIIGGQEAAEPPEALQATVGSFVGRSRGAACREALAFQGLEAGGRGLVYTSP